MSIIAQTVIPGRRHRLLTDDLRAVPRGEFDQRDMRIRAGDDIDEIRPLTFNHRRCVFIALRNSPSRGGLC